MDTREHLLRIEDVAEWTGVSVNTLRFWKAQEIELGAKAAKFGRRLVWRESDVRAWIDAKFTGDPDPAA